MRQVPPTVQVLIISEDISFDTFKRVAGEKLNIRKPRRVCTCVFLRAHTSKVHPQVFHANSSEISDVHDISNNDNLYFSAGEPFYRAAGVCCTYAHKICGRGRSNMHMDVQQRT
jgi:hypothetical protein